MLSVSLVLLGAGWTVNAEHSVVATLSSGEALPGQSLVLRVEVDGAVSLQRPNISVDGLRIDFQTSSMQVQMRNMHLQQKNIYEYKVVPLREGEFVIPPIEIDSGGRTARSEPISLRVRASSAAVPLPPTSQPPNQPNQPTDGGRGPVFLDIVVPGTSLFEGEAVPVETRLYVDTALRFGLEVPPVLQDDGFVVKRISEPAQSQHFRDGRQYHVMSFRGLATPAKSGQLALGPAVAQAIIEQPIATESRRQDPFGQMFDESFFGNPFARTERRRVEVKSEPLLLEVKPLPVAGRPSSFRGAVGNFEMDVQSGARSASVGEPITLTLTLRGSGDFDRVHSPVIAEMDGWRTYPPTSEFIAEDDLGLRGKKTFQIVVIPDKNHTEIPVIEFSFFDPQSEEFVVLRSDALPIEIGGVPRSGLADRETDLRPEAAAGDLPERAPSLDILQIARGPDSPADFSPLWERPVFWVAQLVPLSGIFAWIAGVLFLRRRETSRPSRERIDRENELAVAVCEWRAGPPSEEARFAVLAVQILRLRAWLASDGGVRAESLGLDDIARALGLDSDPKVRAAVERVFNVRDAWVYGGSGDSQGLADGDRELISNRIK